jgi:uncharacterized surface protein with fasciclin (FAS1) repeats
LSTGPAVSAGLTASKLLENAELSKILFQQVIPAALDSVSANAANGLNVDTVQAATLVTIDIQGGELFVEGSKVIATDIIASNGIIHVIDKVIFTTD